jgi:hypothetical protein
VGATAPKYPTVGAEGSCTEGEYTLTAWGHDFYWGWDRGGFAYYAVPGTRDFSFAVRVADAEDLFCSSEKVGICVREGLTGNERAIQLRWDGYHDEVYWFHRFTPGITISEFCTLSDRKTCFHEGATGATALDGVELKIARIDERYHLYVNDTPVAESRSMTLTSDPVYVGLIFSCGGADTPISERVRFDKLRCSGVCPEGTAVLDVTAPGARPNGWSVRFRERRFTVTAPTIARAASARTLVLFDAAGTRLARLTADHVHGRLITFSGLPATVHPGFYLARVGSDDGAGITRRIMIVE